MQNVITHFPKMVEKKNNSRRNGWLAILGTVATIAVAIPLVVGWVGNAFEVAKTPAQVSDLRKDFQSVREELAAIRERLAAQEAAQKENKESLARIERALRIPPKQKDEYQ